MIARSTMPSPTRHACARVRPARVGCRRSRRGAAEPRARRSRRPSPSSWHAAEEGAARHRPGARRRLGDCRRRARRRGAERLPELFLDRSAFLIRRVRGEIAAVRADDRQDDRRAHGDQPEQGGAYRPPAERGARGHAGPGAAVPRRPVEIQNYIDDTGVQVADVIVGFRELEGQSLDEVRAIADSTRFDYYCWDLYARVTEWYEQDKERLEIRAATLHDHRARHRRAARWARSSWIGSSARTWRRWRG